MIAFCGLACSACPAFLATQKDDDDERQRVAEMWSKQYNADIKPGDINCSGCISQTGPFFNYCSICEIRKCGQAKNIENCAGCGDYACEKLGRFFDMAPDAKRNLEQQRGKYQA